ncbi:MAG TPA: hypothetical protein VLK25_05670 [Allosphingosinicella sp.]|nr:hypothetical protein [Allosphingosinicella sp.]
MIGKSGLVGLAALAVLSLPAAASAAPRTGELRESRCDTLEQDGRHVLVVQADDLRVLRDTALGGAFNPGFAPSVAGVLCSRSSIVPGAFDDEVIWLGLPLHLSQAGSPSRLAVLEIDHGRYRYRMIEGPAPDATEQAAIDARLAEFQARLIPTR